MASDATAATRRTISAAVGAFVTSPLRIVSATADAALHGRPVRTLQADAYIEFPPGTTYRVVLGSDETGAAVLSNSQDGADEGLVPVTGANITSRP